MSARGLRPASNLPEPHHAPVRRAITRPRPLHRRRHHPRSRHRDPRPRALRTGPGRAQHRPDDHRGVPRRRQRRRHLQRRLRRALQRLLDHGLPGRQEPAVPHEHQHRGAQHVRRVRAAVGLGAGALLLPRQGQRRHQRRRDPEDPGRVLLPLSRCDCRAGLPGRLRERDQPGHRRRRASRSAAASTTPRARSSTSSATAPARPATRARSRPAPSRRPGPTSAWARRPTPTTTTPTSRSARSRPVRTTATASRRP